MIENKNNDDLKINSVGVFAFNQINYFINFHKMIKKRCKISCFDS